MDGLSSPYGSSGESGGPSRDWGERDVTMGGGRWMLGLVGAVKEVGLDEGVRVSADWRA